MSLDGRALGLFTAQTEVVEGEGRDRDQEEAKERIERAGALGAVVDGRFHRRASENPGGVGLHGYEVQGQQINQDD